MRFTDDQITRFTEGDCWLLALAMKQLAPHAQVAVLVDSVEYGHVNWCHAGVVNEQNEFLDIYGLHDINSLKDRWGASEFFVIEEGEEEDFFAGMCTEWGESERDAISVAEELVELL